MLVLCRELYRCFRFLYESPAISRDGALWANSFRSLAFFCRFGGDTYFEREVVDAHVRPDGTAAWWLRLRFLVQRRSLVSHDCFWFPAEEEFSVLDCLRCFVQVGVRSRCDVVKLESLELFFGAGCVSIFVGLHCTVAFEVACPVAGGDDFIF